MEYCRIISFRKRGSQSWILGEELPARLLELRRHRSDHYIKKLQVTDTCHS